MSNLSDKSIDYIRNTDLKYRKKMGQYFTTQDICQEVISHLPRLNNLSILEPSAGSGEFILSILQKYDDVKLTAVEIDPNLSKLLRSQFSNIDIVNEDFLKYNPGKKFDIIIGNPPYFEFKLDSKLKNDFSAVINGRVNIYSLFIKKSIDLLNDNGILAFVVPPSMNSGFYFSKLRRYIIDNTNIELIKVLNANHFVGANQSVMILILKKQKNDGKFIFKKGDNIIFSENYKELKEYSDGKFSLKELGFTVKTGEIVWNERKNILSNDSSKVTLIWSKNITSDNIINLDSNHSNGQFIDVDIFNTEKAIAVNRIVGQTGKAKIRAAIIPFSKWVAENHVNVIYPTSSAKISLDSVVEQLTSENTAKFIIQLTGNTQISKNELENLIPFEYK